MPTPTARSSPLEIEADATRTEIAGIARYLQDHLGQQVTAYLGGLKDAKTVGQWAAGKVRPRDAASLRLRHAYQAARLIAEAFGDETTKAWLFGTNSHLEDEAPALVLRQARLPEEVKPVVQAARAFTESGRRPTSSPAVTVAERTRELAERLHELQRAQENISAQLAEIVEALRPESRKSVQGVGR